MAEYRILESYNFWTQAYDYSPNIYLQQWVYPNSHYKADAKKMQHRSSPSGTPEFVNRISLRGTLQPAEWLKITAQPGWVCIMNYNHNRGHVAKGFEVALSVECFLLRF